MALFFAVFFMFSCDKDEVVNPNNCSYLNSLEQFVAVWEGLNSAYALWQYDTTDWDRIYDNYYPIFANPELPDSQWKQCWSDLTFSLLDHHTTICIRRPETSSLVILTPGSNEVASRPYYHSNRVGADRYKMISSLLNSQRLTNYQESRGDYNSLYAFSGILDGNIAYLSLPQFNITEQICDNNSCAFEHFKELINGMDIEAAIIDVRGNGGGTSNDIHEFMSCFTDEPILVGFTQCKIGLGRLDLGPRIPLRAFPKSGNSTNIPIVMLVDVHSASMSEIATLAVKQLPNGYAVGERTYGAFSPLTGDFEYWFSGSFGKTYGEVVYGDEVGHSVRTPYSCFTTIEGGCLEGVGIIPDKECLFDSEKWENGVDNQLEAAILFARNKVKLSKNISSMAMIR